MILDEEDAGAKSSLISSPYVLILDTNVILDQVSRTKSNNDFILRTTILYYYTNVVF